MHWKNSAKWYELLKDDSESETEYDDIDYMRERFEDMNIADPFAYEKKDDKQKMSLKGISIRERMKLKTNNLRSFSNQLNLLNQMLEN